MSESAGKAWVPVSINNSNAGRLWERLDDVDRAEIRIEYQETRKLGEIVTTRWCRVHKAKKQ